jgi:hypothetical protein
VGSGQWPGGDLCRCRHAQRQGDHGDSEQPYTRQHVRFEVKLPTSRGTDSLSFITASG